MLSLTTTPTHFCFSLKPISHLNVTRRFPVLNAKKRTKITRQPAGFCCFVGKGSDIFGFLEVGKARFRESCCCWCKERWESEGDTELEAEILEFMEKSSKSGAFPSKKELVEAGRLDLLEAIKNRGGWFSMGWESDSEDEANEEENVTKGEVLKLDFDIKDFQRRIESWKGSGSSEEAEDDVTYSPFSEDSSSASNQPASSSGRSLEKGIEEDSGIDGILNRLEKERTSSFGINIGMSVHRAHLSSEDPGDYRHYGTSKEVGSNEDGNHSHYTKPKKLSNGDGNDSHCTKPEKFSSGDGNDSHCTKPEKFSSGDGNDSHYTKPDTWRSWSLQRAGFTRTEFEAAEISYGGNRMEDNRETSKDEGVAAAADGNKALHKWNLMPSNHIQTRLQDLQLELASALNSLRSENGVVIPKKVLGNASSDLQLLSDELEFQQNEFMSSQERLRSMRSKLAVLEGKMALAIADAQKILEEKQMRIDSACRTLELLHTACIVWPNSASEVLLTGSFDGWTTQRKMKKSRTGIFSVCLKLYPGRYEIKFIVDGKWRVDPLRPIVVNNGHENNLLIIKEKMAQNSELLGSE